MDPEQEIEETSSSQSQQSSQSPPKQPKRQSNIKTKKEIQSLLKSDPTGRLQVGACTKQRTGEVWNNFREITLDAKRSDFVQCSHCGDVINAVSSGKNTRGHLDVCKKLKKVPHVTQSVISPTKRTKPLAGHLKKKIHRLISRFVVKSNTSFSVAGSHFFRKFLSDISEIVQEAGHPIDFHDQGVVPNRMLASRHARQLGNEVQMAMIDLFKSGKILSAAATCDHWTDGGNKHHYLGVTVACIIDGEKLRRAHFVLALQEVTGRSAADLGNDYKDVMQRFGLWEKIDFVITDSASVNKCAFSKKDAFEQLLQAQQAGDIDEESGDLDDYRNSIAEDVDFVIPELPFQEQKVACLDQQWIGCAAHQLQLASKAAFNKHLNKSNSLYKLVNHCQTVVNSLRKTSLAQEFAVSLKKHTEIRWDSRLESIQSLLRQDNRSVLEKAKEDYDSLQDDLLAVLDSGNQDILSQFCDILTLIRAARLAVTEENKPTLGILAVVKHKLISDLEKFAKDSTHKKVVKDFASDVSRCVKEKVIITELHAAASLVVLPKVVCRATIDRKTFAAGEELLRKLVEKISENESEIPLEIPVAASSIFSHLSLSSSQEISELERFFNCLSTERDNIDLYWWDKHRSQFPNVFKIAVLFFAPATSVKAEREFSEAGSIIGKKRFCLKPETLNDLMVYHSNELLIQDKVITLPDV